MSFSENKKRQGSMESSNRGIPAITGQLDYSNAIHVFPDALQPFRSTILAYGASFISTTVGFPMDTVKTRMQTHKHFLSYLDCVKKTYHHEGAKGFFRGIWAPLISTSISKSLSVMIFTEVKPYCYNMIYGKYDNNHTVHPLLRNVPVCMISGTLAGAGISAFACPFEFTKIYAQILKLVQKKSMKDLPKHLQTNHQEITNISTSQIIRQIIKHEGVRGLYSGYKYHLIRDSLSSGIYYSIYESMKWTMNELIKTNPNESSHISILLAGGFSGIFSWILIFPIDTTKSLIQRDLVANILRKEQGLEPLPIKERKLEGFHRKLYRGLGISVTRSFIVNMVFFSVYEFVMAHVA